MFSLLLPQMLLLGALAVLAAMLYGTAALWAAAGRAGWLQRIAPITLLLAALFPIGAYDLFALYLSQALVTIGITWMVCQVRKSSPAAPLRHDDRVKLGAS